MIEIIEKLDSIASNKGSAALARELHVSPTAIRYARKALNKPFLAHAIALGVFADGRVIDALSSMGDVAAKAVLGVEHRLGRTLTRAKAMQLADVYAQVRAKRFASASRRVICIQDYLVASQEALAVFRNSRSRTSQAEIVRAALG